MSFERQYVTSY